MFSLGWRLLISFFWVGVRLGKNIYSFFLGGAGWYLYFSNAKSALVNEITNGGHVTKL